MGTRREQTEQAGSPGTARPGTAAKGRWIGRIAFGAGVATLIAVVGAGVFVALPLPEHLLDYRPVASLRILDRDGNLLRELRSRQDGRATPLRSDQIPDRVKRTFVAAEDHRFYSHHGVDPIAVARALVQNVTHGRIVSGGSTLTQQLARTLIPRERTLLGKIQEALWALRLEAHLDKDEILTQYLNRVPFGNGTFGLEAAAQLYFGRSAEHLSIAQTAVLASIPRGPTAYNPYRRPERLDARKHWVLERMVETGALSREDAELAKDDPIDLRAFASSFRTPHFVEFLASHLDRFGVSDAAVIQTTIDPSLQARAEEAVQQEIGRLADRNVGSAAALVVDNPTGEVLAYVGSADFFDEVHEGQNDGVQMLRQPGSALKPFVYLEAFSAGYSPATVLSDTEAHFGGVGGEYSPENYDRRTHGPVRVREALANSYNVPAVRVGEQLGPERVLRRLHRAGFDSLDKGAEHYGLGIVLGDGEVSLWEAARAYSGLSRGGVLRPLRPILHAWRADGTEIALRDEIRPRRFAPATNVALIADILSDNSARARAFGIDNVLRLPFPTAAKTGTSKGYSDNWTVGFTHERTVAVWAGNFDGSPMTKVSGITGAGPIFRALMLDAMRGVRPAPLYDDSRLEHARICPLSGQLATDRCPSSMDEVFAKGGAPAHECTMHAPLSDSLPEELAEKCAELAGPRGTIEDLGPEYYEWARNEGLAKQPWLAAVCRKQGARTAASNELPRITYPTRNAEFLLFPDLPLNDQAIPVRIRAAPSFGMIDVRLDGELVFSLEPPFVGRIAAKEGAHRLTLHRPGDPRVLSEVPFVVRAERRVF
ncbi:MAG: penicillin-binding protein 1C [Myxococcaceae bacterium]|nr:penicillin-binding protein 1C [Myxococcaceae bacterium]